MILRLLSDALRHESAAIEWLAAHLDESHEEAVRWILGCRGRIVTCGVGKSGHIARKAAGTLASTGTPSLFLHAAEALHGDLGMITAADIVLMVSHSGESDELVRLFPSIAAIGARTVLITGRKESSAGRLADLVLETGVREEACPNNLAPTTSTTVMLALCDALALAAMSERKFTADDFAKFHPSGALGKRLLLRVRDVMRSGADVPLLAEETALKDVLRAITKAGAGAACVTDPEGRLLGLITDGDLRRRLLDSPSPFTDPASAIMTRNPFHLGPDLLAIEALEFFQNLPKKVGEIPVVENEKVLGLIVLKDLLRSGIV